MARMVSASNRNEIRSMNWGRQKPAVEEEAQRVGCLSLGSQRLMASCGIRMGRLVRSGSGVISKQRLRVNVVLRIS